jgi:hypothetical protein
MKKIYLAALLILSVAHSFAQWKPSRQNYQHQKKQVVTTPTVSIPVNTATSAFHITLPAVNNYTITIGGYTMTFYGSQFFFENITPGLIQMTVTYTVAGNNGTTVYTTYNGAINFETNIRVFATVDNAGVLRITQREMMIVPVTVPQQPVTPQPGYVPPVPNYQPAIAFATQQQLDNLVQRLKNISFDNSKVQTAKNSIKGAYYTSAQVKTILETFSFDSYKLEVAKYAYDHSYDKGNFFLVGDAFTHRSYADDLEEYIASK